MPTETHLKLEQTFEAQYELVNKVIVPTIMEALDLKMYPVGETVIYDMLHVRHKHQREEYLKKRQSEEFQDQQARRKHQNSRRNDVCNYFCFNSFYFTNFIILLYSSLITETDQPDKYN
jgi:hypothetical protein